MEEVITRRLKHSIENPKGGFGTLPDVILADGGITQIRATKKAIENVKEELQKAKITKEKLNGQNIEILNRSLDIPVFGMVKNDKHQTRALIDENRKELKISQNLMNLITKFQDIVHDTAISYHRKLREKSVTKSELDDIFGIGDAKKRELLKHFGSIQNIKHASIEELMQVKGISKSVAENIFNWGRS